MNDPGGDMDVVRRFGAALLVLVVLSACAMAEDGRAAENERVISDFIAAWPRMDPVELAGYFTEDGIYHNMPSSPVQGRDNVESLIRGFTADWTETEWEVVTMVSSGDVVIAERVDRTAAGERSVDLPVIGVFEMENGLIREWRDYFDLGTYTRAMN